MAELTLRDLVLQHKKLFHDNESNFQATFGVPLHRFWNVITGFDVIKFDDWLKTPDGTSTRDYITSKYGDQATKLTESLL